MKLFIAGICGTFMAGVAQIAQSLGHDVTGCDANVYPPMSDVLANAGIDVSTGYEPAHIPVDCDCVIIGNALSRGNKLVEHVLDHGLCYTSGPEWLGRHLLGNRRVVAVAGTHGKTSTAAMVAWILEQAGLHPGFLIGGKPGNFGVSARVGNGDCFVIEADEYDTAFFDKRSKFVHYRADIAVLNNLEFDHADIFDDLGQIQRQFHHLVRTVPGVGRLVVNGNDRNLREVLDMGCWSPVVTFANPDSSGWTAAALTADASRFEVRYDAQTVGEVDWRCIGQHNMLNAMAAIVAATECGVGVDVACTALGEFQAGARRLQRRVDTSVVKLYEDFAHHPTAIRMTLAGLRAAHPNAHLLALIEPRSNTMQMSIHEGAMAAAIAEADTVFFYTPGKIDWDPLALNALPKIRCYRAADAVVDAVAAMIQRPLVIVAMSNGGFDQIPSLLEDRLRRSADLDMVTS